MHWIRTAALGWGRKEGEERKKGGKKGKERRSLYKGFADKERKEK